MSEQMSDVDLGVKIIREVWSDNPAPYMAAITIAKLGAAARRLVHEDLQNQIERLTAERDSALACEAEAFRTIDALSKEVKLRRIQCVRMGMALSHIKDAVNLEGARMTADIALIVASPENIPHDAEADAHSPFDRLGAWLSAALDDPQVCEEMKADIRAWFAYGKWPSAPLPAHQSSTQTGTNATTGHS